MLDDAAYRSARKTESTVTLDTLIPDGHIIRKLDAAVDWEKRCTPLRAWYNEDRGRPAFEPDVLLAIALLRHIYHLDSLRAASAEFQTNLVYRWFIGCPLHENVPHFSTISANMLHRIPKKVFEEAFAGALCDILDAGVFAPHEIIYESPFLRAGGWLQILTNRYYVLTDQLTLAIPVEKSPEKRSRGKNSCPDAEQISFL